MIHLKNKIAADFCRRKIFTVKSAIHNKLYRIIAGAPFVTLTILLFSGGCRNHTSDILTIASTTSAQDTGLFDELLDVFEKKHKCRVRLIAVGTGQAIRIARDGNADILFVHDKDAEEKFIDEGCGEKRIELFGNDFIIVGPATDPAGAKNSKSAAEAFRKIAGRDGACFVSRGDNSGTHKRELIIWEKSQLNPSTLAARRYIESGGGMIETLRIADEKSAYALTDKATFLMHKRKELPNTEIILDLPSGDFSNPYSVISLSPSKYPRANHRLAQKFISFVTQEEGKEIIKNFGAKTFAKPVFTTLKN